MTSFSFIVTTKGGGREKKKEKRNNTQFRPACQNWKYGRLNSAVTELQTPGKYYINCKRLEKRHCEPIIVALAHINLTVWF